MQREVGPKLGLYMVQAIRHLMRSISMKTKEKQRFMVGASLFSSLLFLLFSFLFSPSWSRVQPVEISKC